MSEAQNSTQCSQFWHRKCAEIVAEYIVVFKEGVSKDQINQYAEELKNNGIAPHCFRSSLYSQYQAAKSISIYHP